MAAALQARGVASPRNEILLESLAGISRSVPLWERLKRHRFIQSLPPRLSCAINELENAVYNNTHPPTRPKTPRGLLSVSPTGTILAINKTRHKTSLSTPTRSRVLRLQIRHRTLLRTSIAMGVPRVRPSGERPERISTWSSSFLGVVMRDCPGFRRSSSAAGSRSFQSQG